LARRQDDGLARSLAGSSRGVVRRRTGFPGLCEDAGVPAEQPSGREATRTHIFDTAQTLAGALIDGEESERWEPLRDLILAGLEAGGLRHAADVAALRSASGELAAAALDARRRAGRKTPSRSDQHCEAS
jgi:hypothetical protein